MTTERESLFASGGDPIDIAEQWVEVALQGRPWETRSSATQENECWLERGTTRDGDWEQLISTPLPYADACIIERLLEVARGES